MSIFDCSKNNDGSKSMDVIPSETCYKPGGLHLKLLPWAWFFLFAYLVFGIWCVLRKFPPTRRNSSTPSWSKYYPCTWWVLERAIEGSFQILLFVVCRRKVLPNMSPKRVVPQRYHVICSAHDFWHLCTFSVRDGVKALNQSRCDTTPFLISSNVLFGRYFNALKVQ